MPILSNEQLLQLKEIVSQKKDIEATLNLLKDQHYYLSSKVRESKKTMQDAQATIDRLEKTSLTSICYSIIGKKDDVLSQKKSEAHDAKAEYEHAEQELSSTEESISQVETLLCELSGCEQQYQTLLHQKCVATKESGSADATQILEIEKKITAQYHYQSEIREAISAGCRAISAANSVIISLQSAEGYGICDLAGGGLPSDILKHSHLDEAQSQMMTLQSELHSFQSELTDIQIYANNQVTIDGFLRFADYFADGPLVDWLVLDQIYQSESDIQSIQNQIEGAISKLYEMQSISEQTIEMLESEKESIIINAII